jgi:uncharacterized protein (DUF1501 family)
VAQSVRDMVRQLQVEIRDTPDLQPDRASELMNRLTALMGNVNDEIREADVVYAHVLLQCLESEDAASRAKIRAETTPAYQRKREARDTKELTIELVRSLKYYLRAKTDEMRLTR